MAFDSVNEVLYVAKALATGSVHAYRLNQTVVVETDQANGIFASLRSASAIAYDGQHDLVCVTECACNDSVEGFSAFTADGHRVGTVETGGNPLGSALAQEIGSKGYHG
jgi:hypothetical protein